MATDNRLIEVYIDQHYTVYRDVTITSPSGAKKTFFIKDINDSNREFINFLAYFRFKFLKVSVETLKLFSQLCDEQPQQNTDIW